MQKGKKRLEDDRLRGRSMYMRVEVNFIISKFLELPLKKQRKLHMRLKSDKKGQFLSAAKELINFILDNPIEMAEFASPGLLNPWSIPSHELERKTDYIGVYFKTYLQEQVKFTIEKIL